MDGNGRWAERHGEQRVFGHQNGVKSVRDTTEAAAELGIKYLTLMLFQPRTESSYRRSKCFDGIIGFNN